MKAVIDNLTWFRRNEIDEQVLRTRLCILVENDYDDTERILKMFEVRGEWFGVPRAYGINNFSISEIRDNTVVQPIAWPVPVIEYRVGQEKAVQEITNEFLVDKKYGALLEGACGSGKTLCAMSIAANLNQKTLILVHKNDLAEQWHETGRQFFPGIRMGHCQQSAWDYRDKHAVTAMAQTLWARRDDLPKDFWEHFGLVIYDEGHRYPARTFEQVLRTPPARYRLAVSATWRRKDGLDCVWHWHIGSVEHRMGTERLVGEYVQIVWNTNLVDEMFKRGSKINSARYLNAIARSKKYNLWIADQIVNAVRARRKVLVVSDRIAQLILLRQNLLARGASTSIGLYIGAISGKRLTKEQLENAKDCEVVLATFGMMSEGTDVPALDTLFFATPRGDVEQVVGRIQRPMAGKKPLLIIDPVFNTRYNRGLGGKREKTYLKLGFIKQE